MIRKKTNVLPMLAAGRAFDVLGKHSLPIRPGYLTRFLSGSVSA